jgi:hypothetical protein
MSSEFRGPAIVLMAFFALPGCAATQNPTSAAMPLGAMTQSQAHKASTSSGDLLYISQHTNSGWSVVAMTPQGRVVNEITDINEPWQLCSDSSGDVWVPSWDYTYEFAHGGTTPIASLYSNDFFASACSVDPTTGNLAVVGSDESGGPQIAVWRPNQGYPTYYSPPFRAWSVGYDNQGNLFLDGYSDSQSFLFAELPQGSSSFTTVTLDQPAKWPGNVQWDGKDITVSTVNPAEAKGRRHVIYRMQVSGSTGHVVDTIYLDHAASTLGSWVQGNIIVGVQRNVQGGRLWHYPKGGRPFEKISGFQEAWGVTVSVAPSQSRRHK